MDVVHSFLRCLFSPEGILTLAVIAALIVCYLLLKNLLKAALIFIVVILACGGYLYVKNPSKMIESVKQTVTQARTITVKFIETSKNVYRDASELINKGKRLPAEIDQLIGGKKAKETPPE